MMSSLYNYVLNDENTTTDTYMAINCVEFPNSIEITSTLSFHLIIMMKDAWRTF